MDISSIVGSLVAIKDLVAGAVDERDRNKLATIQSDLTNKIAEAQTQLLQLLGTVIEQQRLIPVLEQRIRELEAAQAEKARYKLAKVGASGEFFAYQLRSAAELGEAAGEVDHFLCQPCFDIGKKAVLTGNGSGFWCCPVCKHGRDTGTGSNVAFSGTSRNDFRGF